MNRGFTCRTTSPLLRQADRYYVMQQGGVVANGAKKEISKVVIEKFLRV